MLASILRLVTLAVLVGYVIRDIRHPEMDVVRDTYEGEDPDGGAFNSDEASLIEPPPLVKAL